MTTFHCQFMTGFTIVWAAMWGNIASGADVSKALSAVCIQRVHPVLIRNQHNCLVQVVVDVARPGVQVTQFTFSLRGTDDLADIDSLRL